MGDVQLPVTRRALLAAGSALIASAGRASAAVRWSVPYGDPSARVRVLEFSSLGCGFCSRFRTETWPRLKAAYVDTGRVHWRLHPYPLDNPSAAGFLVARCAGRDAASVIEAYFRSQSDLLSGRIGLRDFALSQGIAPAAFDACMSDRAGATALAEAREAARSELGVASTPTFFVDGSPLVGALPYAEFASAIDRALRA